MCGSHEDHPGEKYMSLRQIIETKQSDYTSRYSIIAPSTYDARYNY